MKISMLLKTILFGMLLIAPLSAQTTNESHTCIETYDICAVKCESLGDGFEECIVKCDIEYETCSESEDSNKKDSD